MVNLIKFSRAMNTPKKFFFREHRILKICFMALTTYLLINEMKVFLIDKPTLTSRTQTKMYPEIFPDVLICPEQAFDLDSLLKLGYKHNYNYGHGYLSEYELLTWLGNQTVMSITEVADKVSSIKSLDNCPKVYGRLKTHGQKEVKEIILSLELTRVSYPYGRCCRVIEPKEAEIDIITQIRFIMEHSKMTNYTTGLNMYLSNKNSASLVQPPKFVIDGPQFNANSKQTGYKKYRIKLLEEIHLEEDPHFPCRNYEYDGEYNQCLEEEYTRQSVELLNCAPPWMTDDQDIWCKQNVKGSSELREKSRFLLGK